ncbi:hypothetical protein FA15DRAFT_77246 [Coprinopsis marcescibilis]|uniref:Uncharacterized protein n=1 Tax=Coprinopsis marcescibilis TaxID=230819 RepID=A0A5C3KZY7_COPMA|nr:hypothetical protein FA15DRAFT_77246 [Coprinopsis marcescibilis]
MINHDFSMALEQSASQAPNRQKSSSQDTRPKSYSHSQSYSSRLFELELSPIFEDIQVFNSNNAFIVPADEDSQDPLPPDRAFGSNQNLPLSSEDSESSYGELIEEKTFGSTGYDIGLEDQDEFALQDDSLVYGKVANESDGVMECMDEANSNSDNREAMEHHLQIPSLMLTYPTPEQSKSSGFSDSHNTSEGRGEGFPRSSSSGQVVEETTYEARNGTPTLWSNTVESSVNTTDGRGLGVSMDVDEHGQGVRTNQWMGKGPSTLNGTKQGGTRAPEDRTSRKRWPLTSIRSKKSKACGVSSGTRDRAFTESLWSRISGTLLRRKESRSRGSRAQEHTYLAVNEAQSINLRTQQESGVASAALGNSSNGIFHSERNTGTSAVEQTRVLGEASSSGVESQERPNGMESLQNRFQRSLARRKAGFRSSVVAHTSSSRKRFSALFRSGDETQVGCSIPPEMT